MTDFIYQLFPSMTGRALWADIPLSAEEEQDRHEFNTFGEGAELLASVLKEVSLLRSERATESLFAALNGLSVMQPLAAPTKKSVRFQTSATPIVSAPSKAPVVAPVVPSGPVSDTLILHNIPRDTTEEELRGLFGVHGDILRIAIPIDKNRRSPHFGGVRGFAIIQFASSDQASSALTPITIRGKLLSIEFSFK